MGVTGDVDLLDPIDGSTWDGLVARSLGTDTVSVTDRRIEPIHVGAGTGSQLFRVRGTARAAACDRPWSLVVKVFTTDHLSFQFSSPDLRSPGYWKREWLTYRSDWLATLSGPLVAPRCWGSGEYERVTGPVAWVALEDLGDLPHQWSLPDLAAVARDLGRFTGGYLAGHPDPTDPWLADGRLAGWTEPAEPAIPLLPSVSDHPDAGRIVPRDVAAAYLDLWEHRRQVYAALDALPAVFSHLDVFPRNVRRRRRADRTENVAIDWAFCGTAPLGAELVPLIGATIAFLGYPPDQWEELEEICVEGYLDGLRSSGWSGSEEGLRFCVTAGLPLRIGLGPLPAILGATMEPAYHDVLERAFDCSFEEFLVNSAAVGQFLAERGRRTVESLA